MSAIDTLRDALFGNPPQPNYPPSREGTLAAFTELSGAIDAAVNDAVAYDAVADLPVVTTANNGDRARVYDDPTAENNTYWIVKGGAWEIDVDLIASIATVVQPLVDDAEAAAQLAQDWSEGTEPGGPGTKSAKEWSEDVAGLAPTIDDLVRDLAEYSDQELGITTTPVLASNSTTNRTWHCTEAAVNGGVLTRLEIRARAATAVTYQTLAGDGSVAGSVVFNTAIGLNIFSDTDVDATAAMPASVPEMPAGGSMAFFENGNALTHSTTASGSAWEYKAGLNAAIGGWTATTAYVQIRANLRKYSDTRAVTAETFNALDERVAAAEDIIAPLTVHITDRFGEVGTTLGDGTSGLSASVLVFKSPALVRDNKMVGLRMYPRATGAVKVGATSSVPATGPAVITGAYRGQLNVAADTNAEQTIYFDTPLQYYAGEYIELYGSAIIGLEAGTATGGGYWIITGENWSTAGTSSAGASRIMVEFLFEDDVPVTQDVLLAGQGASTLKLSNVDKIVLVSNSYGESKATLRGKSDSMNASALSEYNWGNISLGGQGCAELAAIIANNTVRFGVTFAQLHPTYAILREQQNSKITNGLSDATYYRDYQRLIDTTRGAGAEPVIVTEWGVGVDTGIPPAAVSVDGEQRNVKGLRALADANGLIFVDGTSKSRTMNPSAYGPYWKSAHFGTRMAYISSDALIRAEAQMPRPKRSMKIFRVRGTVTVTTVADLVFTSLQERHHLFRELYLGHTPLNNTGRQYYDTTTALGVAGYNDNQDDEYHHLDMGTATALGEYALLDCVLEFANARDVRLQLSDTTITVYALKKTNTGASWVALALDADNLFEVLNDQGFVSYDRVRFLLYKSGGVSLTASPVVTNGSGVKKERKWTTLPAPPTGAELLVQPLVVVGAAIPAQWTNAGALAVATLVDGATYLPGANQTSPLTTGGVEVTSSAGLAQDVPLVVTDDPVEVVIRVWARRQPALFSSASDWSTAPINEETCDTATLLVTLHGATGITSASAPMKAQVGLAHTEIEFRMMLPAYSTSRRIDVRSLDLPILVTKVSVKRA